jgi:hypothetical protein
MRSKWTSALVFHEKRPVWRAPFAHRSRARSGSAQRRSISASQPRGDFGSARHRRRPPADSPCRTRRLGSPGHGLNGGQPEPFVGDRKAKQNTFRAPRDLVGDETEHVHVGRGRTRVDRGEIHARKIHARCPRQPRYPIPMRQVPAMENSISTFLCTARPTSKKTKGR